MPRRRIRWRGWAARPLPADRSQWRARWQRRASDAQMAHSLEVRQNAPVSTPIADAANFWDLLERRAQLGTGQPFLLDDRGRMLTAEELKASAEATAAGLAALGVTEGTVVSWQLPSRIDTVVLSMALSRLGAVQNPILHVYRDREVRFALQELRPALWVLPGHWRGFDYQDMAGRLTAELASPPLVLDVGMALPQGDPSTLPPPPTPSAGEADPVRWIYYTSGTTSAPKGVRHTDRTLLAGGRALAIALRTTEEDIGSIAFPFTHIAGPDYLAMMLINGVGAVILEVFDPEAAVATFARLGVTVAGGSTAFYSALLDCQRKRPEGVVVPSLRMLAGGGAPKPPEIYHEVLAEMGIRTLHGYAMTEVPMLAMGTPDDTDEQLANTDGRAVTGAELRIVGPDGLPVGPDVDGEIRARGPMVCKGYTDDALSAEAFDDEGWFCTGDLGHLRPDGHLVVTGRAKDIIIRKGENISAKELEDLLYAHPKVGAVAVIGLPDPDRGERVCAVVETAPGQDPLTLDEMVGLCRDEGLMTQKIPEQLEVLERLPRNETLNKVRKDELRSMLSSKPT